MKLLKFQQSLKIFTDLKFAIFILLLIAFVSSFGSFIEQDEPIFYYEINYPLLKPIYGFINSAFILNFGLDHIYSTWWFFSLLFLLAISLISCTFTRQFPLFFNSKEFLFKKQEKSFFNLNFFIKLKNIPYLKEFVLTKIHNMNFYTYQKKNFIYGYKGIIGRISPILVHFSLILILFGASVSAFQNFKAQEILPKGEIFRIQNTLKIGILTNLPIFNIRINDFWVEYKNNRIHQFYSNLSILNNKGDEIKHQTISVNNPLHYNGIDFYQSDWNLLGIRLQNVKKNTIYELPLFSLKENTKTWISWISSDFTNIKNIGLKENQKTLIFDQFENKFFLYDSNGVFIDSKYIGEFIFPDIKIIEILPATGLLIKYDPSIGLIYLGFGILMITTFLSYFTYTQIWVFNKGKEFWLGSSTNRGKIQLELELENLIRDSEANIEIFNRTIKKLKKFDSINLN